MTQLIEPMFSDFLRLHIDIDDENHALGLDALQNAELLFDAADQLDGYISKDNELAHIMHESIENMSESKSQIIKTIRKH